MKNPHEVDEDELSAAYRQELICSNTAEVIRVKGRVCSYVYWSMCTGLYVYWSMCTGLYVYWALCVLGSMCTGVYVYWGLCVLVYVYWYRGSSSGLNP